MINKIKNKLARSFKPGSKERVSRYLHRNRILGKAIELVYGRDLTALAKIYGTDKWSVHSYTPIYQNHFDPWRNKRVTMLEIGIGGYADPSKGGESLRMWKRFFPHGRIHGIDIHDKSFHEEKRINIFQGSQTDEHFLREVVAQIGPPDIIIDDGSHLNDHVIRSFEILFPLMKDRGIYVVEDTQTSYWESHGGSSHDLRREGTMVNYFKKFVDGLNHMEFELKGFEPDFFDSNIISLHFYHNLIFIYKGRNDERSNVMINNSMPENINLKIE